MSIIPKIKVSSGRKREKCNLDFDCYTTTNFGAIQPTFAREMIPNSKFEVSVNSLVRMAPMPVPTFGRLYLQHKHVYVPYVDVCPQFDSFIAGQSYKPAAGTSYVPSALPNFRTDLIPMHILAMFADWTVYAKNSELIADQIDDFTDDGDAKPTIAYSPILLDANKMDEDALDWVRTVWSLIFHPDAFDSPLSNMLLYGKTLSLADFYIDTCDLLPSCPTSRISPSFNGILGNWKLGGWQITCRNNKYSNDTHFTWKTTNGDPNGFVEGNPDGYYVTLEDADFVAPFGPADGYVVPDDDGGDVNAKAGDSPALDFIIAFKLRYTGKQIRNILQGLGYQFAPNLVDKVPSCNWLKIFAFYKSWFNLFRPQRELSFTQTSCYDMIKICEKSDAEDTLYPGDYSLGLALKNFIYDLATQCYAYTPQDYFGMSTTSPNNNYMSDTSLLQTNVSNVAPDTTYDDGVYILNSSGGTYVPSVEIKDSGDIGAGILSPATMNVALKVLKYVNKNSIVGRSIHNYIKAHFGVSLDTSHDLETVYQIGDVSIPISVDDVYSTADTTTDHLGSYAGRGLGYNKEGNKFVFENKKNFGVWLTLSCIIPKAGYYQGILRENNNITRYDYFTPEFDALGYDVLLRSEISADYPYSDVNFNVATDSNIQVSKAFGFVPRYSHYKVGRDIVNGDLSLRGHRSQYNGYYLNRQIPYQTIGWKWLYDSDGNVIQSPQFQKPPFIPNVVFDEFRKIDDSMTSGNYNRIFYSEDRNDDHFIISNVFSVDAWLPAKSLNESFDTVTEEDGGTIDMIHS